MTDVNKLITDNMDVWTAAINKRSSQGRGSNKKVELTGIKKLRQLILELAVRGKLVPQDTNEEPASILLGRAAEEKSLLIKDKKIKKQKASNDISDEEKPFKLPIGWQWSKIQDIGYDLGQKTPDNKFTYIDVASINKELGHISEPNVLTADKAPSRARKIVKKGTVIYSTVRPYLLNIAIVDQDFMPAPIASTAFSIIHPLNGILAPYIYRYLRSPVFITYVESVQTGIAYPAINDKQFFSGIIAIPPEAEQHRIVAKVDELMALCDKLEQQTEQSLTAHQTLVETLLATLVDAKPNTPSIQNTPPAQSSDSSSVAVSVTLESPSAQNGLTTNAEDCTANNFQENWQRIADHFDTLFTTESSIESLKQTILQLAVMGKLVPQNPNDEPASVLLAKIAEEKAQLIADKKIKKPKTLPCIKDEEKPFELPSGWEFERLENMTSLITKGSSPKWQGVSYTEDPRDVLFVTSENVGAFELRLDKKKYVEQKFNDVEPRSILKKYDFLMNIVGASIGRTAIYNIDTLANINQAVCLIRSFPSLSCNKYFLTFFNSNICISYMYDKQVDNARPNLSMANISKFVIPVPPLAEQNRIVAKVDELMALCDQLKTRLADAQTTQLHLADAVVENALN